MRENRTGCLVFSYLNRWWTMFLVVIFYRNNCSPPPSPFSLIKIQFKKFQTKTTLCYFYLSHYSINNSKANLMQEWRHSKKVKELSKSIIYSQYIAALKFWNSVDLVQWRISLFVRCFRRIQSGSVIIKNKVVWRIMELIQPVPKIC